MPAPVLQFKRGNAGVAGTVPALRPGEPAISLNNFDFFIGIDTSVANNKFFGSHRYWGREDGTNSLKLKLVDKDGTNYVAIKTPDTLAGIVTYVLPGTQGATSTVLTNDGSGNLSWASGSSNPVFTGIATFTDTTDNTLGNYDTGAVQIDGGLGVAKNVTVGAGLSVIGTSRFAGEATFASSAYFGDNDKLYFGDGNDLEIYHNGENSFIKDAGTGTLNIVASGFSVLNAGANETLANFNPDGSVELYYDNVKKFETTGVGATITGSLGVSGDLNVAGQSYFIGTATFYGGTINLGDSDTDDIVIAGEFKSSLIPSDDASYDIGNGAASKRWRHASFSGIGTFSTGLVADNVRLGVGGNGVVDTTSGPLYLDSASGTTIINDHVDILGDLDVTGNISLGGTTITLRGVDVFIENKDIVLGYTTSVTPNDTTANHAGVAIASTEGTPLANFNASGINTLPDTYKQMMWFQSGTLGFGTDAFAFNYGVAIGTTNMANGVRLAVGTGVTVGDTTVTASTFYGSLVGNVSSADQVKTVSAADNPANYYVTFVDANNGSATNETVYTDDGIYYNPGTNTFTTQNALFTGNVTVNGTLTGTATTATRATLIDTANTTNNSDYYVTFVDTLAGQGSENLRVGLGLSVNPSNGDVKTTGRLSVGNPGDLTSYIKAGGGSDAMYLYSNGDVAFQQKVIVGGLRSSSNSNNTLTLNDLDATFARNLTVTGIATVGTALSSPTLETTTLKSSGGTTALTLSGANVTVSGDLFVNGSTTQVNTTSITVEDRTIEMGVVDGSAPSSATTWDLGVLFNYYTDSAKKSAVVWEHSDSRFKFASVLAADSNGTNNNTPQLTVTTFAPIEVGSLWVTDCAGTSQVISCTGTERFLENITVDAGVF